MGHHVFTVTSADDLRAIFAHSVSRTNPPFLTIHTQMLMGFRVRCNERRRLGRV